jgi:signal transduction histidine kinase
MKTRVEELIDEVKDEARSDMARVRRVVDHMAPRPTLEVELLEEMASALGRVEKRVRDAVTALEAIDPGDSARWDAQREVAARMLRDLAIQRESLRFPRDPMLAERYGVPPPRKRR